LKYQLPFNPDDHILELGGGSNPLRVNGLKTINVDFRQVPGVDIVRDLEGDFSDVGRFNSIFAQYIAEHISWRKIQGFFINCFKILNDGGVAVFVVPDTYEQMRKILQKPPEGLILDDSNFLFGGQDYPENTHKVAFSKPFITKLLKDAGFSEVKIVDHPVRTHGTCSSKPTKARKRPQPRSTSGASP